MKLQFLGSGSAVTLNNFHSNACLEIDGKRLLIDAGSDLRRSLHYCLLTPSDIDAVFISHLHADHCGGLEYLAFASAFDPNFGKNADGSPRRLKLIVHESISGKIWSMLEHGLVLAGKKAGLTDFFDLQVVLNSGLGPYSANPGSFIWQSTKFYLEKTFHCLDGQEAMPCYGLIWSNDKGSDFWYSADTVFDESKILNMASSARLIFHDCETKQIASGVHAHYNELVTLPESLRPKIWLYHYNDGYKTDCEADRFAGWVKKGQIFDLSI